MVMLLCVLSSCTLCKITFALLLVFININMFINSKKTRYVIEFITKSIKLDKNISYFLLLFIYLVFNIHSFSIF